MQPRRVWDENVWITTSGMFYIAPMATVLMQYKPGRIIYSIGHVFGSSEAGLMFLKTLKSEGVASDDVLEGRAYNNAEKLVEIKARVGPSSQMARQGLDSTRDEGEGTQICFSLGPAERPAS